MGGVKPFIFAACCEDYYEKYGIALENSARAHGHECEVIRSGRKADLRHFADVMWHSHWRYKLLPDILEKHDAVLMLDADCVIRKPIEIEPEYELALIVQKMEAYDRKVNGGCVYITSALKPLALKLSDLMDGSHWFNDQIALNRLCVKRGGYKLKTLDDSFISWKGNPDASIWTGKGKNKFRQPFLDEVNKWR